TWADRGRAAARRLSASPHSSNRSSGPDRGGGPDDFGRLSAHTREREAATSPSSPGLNGNPPIFPQRAGRFVGQGARSMLRAMRASPELRASIVIRPARRDEVLAILALYDAGAVGAKREDA